MATETTGPTLTEIEAARRGLEGIARVTPVYASETLSRLVGREVKLKAENLQRTGSFKIRGAYNRISTLEADEVVAASAGNHGQAVAWAAREIGARARGFMPQGELTMSILHEVLDEIVSVNDDQISEAMVLLLERTKLVVEGAGAVGVAALLSGQVSGSGCVVPVLSGGNIDATLLISVMRHGLAIAGRYLVVRSRVPDRPGELAKLLQLLAEERVNVVEVSHYREAADLPVGDAGVELTLVTRDPAHCDEILATMQRLGYP